MLSPTNAVKDKLLIDTIPPGLLQPDARILTSKSVFEVLQSLRADEGALGAMSNTLRLSGSTTQAVTKKDGRSALTLLSLKLRWAGRAAAARARAATGRAIRDAGKACEREIGDKRRARTS
jgi:hypothetical protein